jgi:hypothetical protein
MRNTCICIALLAALLGLSLPGSARAENLKSKLLEALTTSTNDSAGRNGAGSQRQAVSAPPTDDAERQRLDAEARDAVHRALENARAAQEGIR